MGTAMTVLLAFAVYLTLVSDYLPNTSLHTSVLATYLTLLLGFTGLSVLLSVAILRLYHKPDSDPVGVFFVRMTRFMNVLNCR